MTRKQKSKKGNTKRKKGKKNPPLPTEARNDTPFLCLLSCVEQSIDKVASQCCTFPNHSLTHSLTHSTAPFPNTISHPSLSSLFPSLPPETQRKRNQPVKSALTDHLFPSLSKCILFQQHPNQRHSTLSGKDGYESPFVRCGDILLLFFFLALLRWIV